MAPVHEWLYYCDYLLKEEILRPKRGLEGLTNQLQAAVKVWLEGKVKKVLSASGLYHHRLVRVAELIAGVEHLISPQLTGEAILTIAGALTEVIDDVAGVIAIGPFGCMPNRIAEAVAGKCLGREKVRATRDIELTRRVLSRQAHLPFMAIETDGNVFPGWWMPGWKACPPGKTLTRVIQGKGLPLVDATGSYGAGGETPPLFTIMKYFSPQAGFPRCRANTNPREGNGESYGAPPGAEKMAEGKVQTYWKSSTAGGDGGRGVVDNPRRLTCSRLR